NCFGGNLWYSWWARGSGAGVSCGTGCLIGGIKSFATKGVAAGLGLKFQTGKPSGGQRYFNKSWSCPMTLLAARTRAPPAASPSLRTSLLFTIFFPLNYTAA